MSDIRPIGIFDSGLGGLTVLKELKRVLPNESFIYFGDTARVPYGTRSPETIIEYAIQDENFLLSKNVKLMIAACGTVSSVAYETAKKLSVPFFEVVTPAAVSAVKATKNNRIGVIGTTATINSGSFNKVINSVNSNISVFSNACPLFVQLVESGWINDDDVVTVETAKRYLEPLINDNIDTLIMGCTHFPILRDIIAKIVGNDVSLINPGDSVALAVKEYLIHNDMLNIDKVTYQKFYVSDKSATFSTTASILLGEDIENDVECVSVDA